MAVPVKLSDLVDALDTQTDECPAYLHRNTGTIAFLMEDAARAVEENETPDKFPDWMRDAIKEAKAILETEDYLPLPSRYEIHEYRIMERFYQSIPNEAIGEDLSWAIKGKGAFRRFKDGIHSHNIVEDWHGYRHQALKQIAIDWCEGNGIAFLDEEDAEARVAEQATKATARTPRHSDEVLSYLDRL